MINFDNAATTFPKPLSVANALSDAVKNTGGNPSRGGHALALKASQAVYATRSNVADFFGAQAENVVFTINCTHALNFAIKGIMRFGGHVIISSLEHNSVSRPVFALARQNRAVSFSVANVYEDDEKTLAELERLIKPNTKAIVFTLASNVTGQITPYREVGRICKKHKICFIADGSQLCGAQKIYLDDDNIDILCTSGHKGLYGPSGTGVLVSNGRFSIAPIIEGGTGSDSQSLVQTKILPEALESGTVNTAGIIALSKGIDFVRKYSPERIFEEETELCRIFVNGLKNMQGYTVYRSEKARYAPIVSFNYENTPPESVARYLAKNGICMRAGLHCAALAHNQLGTKSGTVRFAPSVFNKKEEVLRTLRILENTIAFSE